ncbi:hypothetical protein AYO38_03080 [bacterium SCGC AG-212-C10]|nr:hypothetical protein AYO38_03080 [bacterium SCGC AG-212-C10]
MAHETPPQTEVTPLENFRYAKDAFYRMSADSPLSEAQKLEFSGLDYFPEDTSFIFAVDPQPFEEQELVAMATSTDDATHYIRWAKAPMQIGNEHIELTVFKDPHTGGLFLPFQDGLRGKETYGAGRYLEPELQPDGRLKLDFNYAYNPYCAYNDAWSCPLPPPENSTNVPIRAGEKVFAH